MSVRKPPDPRLATVIERLREERGLTQEAAAIESGLTLSAFGRIARAEADPLFTTVCDIAQALDVSLEELGRAIESEER
ncbi:MAG TPA: helix-turn-helix transcriptional regulator [Solirubrobacteraceae bacterium]|jgi:transcriptional regulator with XRE-family HTH domain